MYVVGYSSLAHESKRIRHESGDDPQFQDANAGAAYFQYVTR